MKPIRTFFHWLALPGLALCLVGAEPSTIRLPPWYGDNAVLVPADRTKDNEVDLTILYGWSRGNHRPKVRFSTWQNAPIEAGFDDRSRPKDAERRWLLTSGRLKFQPDQSFAAGMAFSFRVEPGSAPTEPALAVSNVVVGQVWVLAVDPERDRYHLEPISAAARERVRVLALTGGSWDAMTGRWLTGGELETNAPTSFSGLPRAFANRLTDPRNADVARDPIGLILVPAPLLLTKIAGEKKAPSRTGFLLGSTYLGEKERKDPILVAASNAGLLANSDATTGARDRYRRAKSEYLARLTELKREGRLGEPFGKYHQEWIRLLPLSGPKHSGDPNLVPFRVTGMIW